MAKYYIVKKLPDFFDFQILSKKNRPIFWTRFANGQVSNFVQRESPDFLDEVHEWPSFKPGLQILKNSNRVYQK